jgi:hypothetical protein
MMNKLKMYNTNLTTMDADLFKQIKNLSAELNKDKNELLEEAAHDLIKKYEHRGSSPHGRSLSNADFDKLSKIEMLGENPLFLPFL